MKKDLNYKNSERGFTLIEILAVIIIIAIIAIIAVPSVSQYITSGKNSTYSSYENSMKRSAENFVIECLRTNKNCNLPEGSEKRRVTLKELMQEGLIDEINDPETKGSCDLEWSYVVVTQKGRGNYEYNACLSCSEYTTENSICG